ncbi:MAG TPA: biopolymer transporter ExbD [Caldithrix abyssi]|uniref:Biopolymer transporter ExbD n=1 Tax=Caldithrix abyssi TaxID=187145 RepID=A0A7V5PQ40_CALAY|nr:biopolymer transporter ExbD [Caldithrix abyssi]
MAFQPSKSKKNLEKEKGSLNLNSMMDMMTIILLFLLKSFSTEGALVTPSEQLRLPEAAMGLQPKKQVTVSIAKDMILVNDIPLVNNKEIPQDAVLIPALAQKLSEYAEKEHELEVNVGKPFTHEVIIEGDQKIHFDLLFKVMYTCSQSEFYKMRLLTIKKE